MKNIPFIQKTGLFYKIASLVLLTLILAIGVSTAVSIREQTKTITTELIEKNKIISKHLASSVKNAFWSLNWLFVEKQMQEITKSEDVTFLELIKPNGEVYLSSGDKELEENVLPPLLMNLEEQILKEGLSPKTDGSIKLIITPLKIGSDKWTLIIGLSLKEVEEAKKRILKNNIIWGSTIFLLGVFVSFFLARGLTKPIKQLVEGTKEIGKRNLDYRINIKSLDELGILADSFNDMAEDLKMTTTSRDQLAIEVNERKQAEEALRESEEKLRTIFDAVPDPIVMYDTQGHPQYLNPAFPQTFGWFLDDLQGGHIPFVPDDQKEITGAKIKELYDFGKPIRIESKRLTKEGQLLDVHISAAIMKNPAGEPMGLVVNLTDITHRKKLEARLQHAQKMESVGTLAGGIAHNFNNLLMGIMGNASLLLMDIDSEHPYCKNLKNIEKQVQNGSKLTAQLIGFAREGKYEVKPISLNQLVQETSNTFGLTRKEIVIHQELDDKSCGIKADQGQIEQTLLNLYVNAADAMPGGGNLFLKTQNVTHKDMTGKPYYPKSGNYTLLTIRDDGAGMDKETRERIFEPFFTTKGLAEGTGLGLASAYGIIKGHGGYIDVNSEKGHGATFSIYLPSSEKEVKDKKELPGEIVKGKETVLLVDDEEVVLDVGEQILDKLGYEVLSVTSGIEALELYEKNQDKIDIVLLDMVMPGMGGGETYDKLRETNSHIKVLLASGYNLDGEAKEILERGCDGFIQKPYSIEELSHETRKILDKVNECG